MELHYTTEELIVPESDESLRRRRARIILLGYPLGILVVSVFLNLLVLGVEPAVVAMPALGSIRAFAVAGILLALNHTWNMMSTEFARSRHRLVATPEEWAAQGLNPENASKEGLRELERHHNMHRNATENAVCFIPLALVLLMISPSAIVATVWLVGFALARLSYTGSYLAKNTGLRGASMTLGLLATFGLASYIAISLMM